MVKGGKMPRTSPLSTLINLIIWLTGVLVSLAVGLGMADGKLTAETLLIPTSVTVVAGWVVVVLTILSVILAIAEKI